VKPIITPKIQLKEATEKKDWVIEAQTVERPRVEVGDYKKAITDLKASKAKKIWVPGSEPKEDKKEETKPTMDDILKTVFDVVTSTLPALLVEQEVNRLLSDLIDQTKKLGLSVDQYLAASGKTADSIRKDYNEQAIRTLTLEFALEEIADKEGILISDDDIDAVIKTAKTDEERESMKRERFYLASVLRRQKTLDFLSAV
jgi:trigger factor